ncbi:MAG: diacylglycerol/lipid kinase family protein [Chitinispirillaceae bacterium]
MRVCLIFNPRAGGAENIKNFILQLTGAHRCELRPISGEQSASRIAREAVDDGFTRIIVAGGDGTINGVVNGIAPDFDSVELAILPFGTGNDLARALGLTPDIPQDACRAAFESRTERIDLIRLRSHDTTSYCVNVANAGLGGRIAADIRIGDKQRWGTLAYWMTSVSRLVNMHAMDIRMTIDDQQMALNAYGLAIANGRFVGGGFPIAPCACLNDGLMDITIVPVLPHLELMAAGLNFTLGRNHREDRIRTYTGRKVHIKADFEIPFSIDGEPTQRLEGEFECIPRTLRVITGDNPSGLTAAFERSVQEALQA